MSSSIIVKCVLSQRRFLGKTRGCKESQCDANPSSSMFKPIPSTRLLRALQASIEDRRLVCSFCSKRRTLKSHRRAFSIQIAPVTAVNEKKPVVESFKDLHNVLIAFGRSASTYANATQLQLALKSLESKDSITRIASKEKIQPTSFNILIRSSSGA